MFFFNNRKYYVSQRSLGTRPGANLTSWICRRADVTADDGSYDRYLDADDWYMENIMRAKKKRQQQKKDQGQV